MIVPSSRLLWVVLAMAASAIAVAIFPTYQMPWLAVAGAFALLALLDLLAG